MQDEVKYRTSLVSKSLPIKKRIFAIYSNSATKAIQYALVRGKIAYRRHKTGKQITLRIPREALPLLKEFKDKDETSLYLFPILNAAPEGDEALYECYQKALRNFNKMLRVLAKRLLPGIKISSYTARHTWATLAYHIGMPIGIICQALGHSSIRVTETYLKPFENEKVDKANRKLISTVKKQEGRSGGCFIYYKT